MGLFGNMFGKKEEEGSQGKNKIPWISLTSKEQLDTISADSIIRPQVIFKHSTTCGISRMALNMFTSSYDLTNGQMNFYFLDLHAHREVSNEVAEKFQVMHQSPQLILIKNGIVVAHDSHGAIAEIDLKKYS